MIAAPARPSPLAALLLLSLAPAGAAAEPAFADRSTGGVESPARFPSAPLRLAELGACNPRIEVCDARDENDSAADGERNDRATERRRRGWLSVVGCNPRIKVCES